MFIHTLFHKEWEFFCKVNSVVKQNVSGVCNFEIIPDTSLSECQHNDDNRLFENIIFIAFLHCKYVFSWIFATWLHFWLRRHTDLWQRQWLRKCSYIHVIMNVVKDNNKAWNASLSRIQTLDYLLNMIREKILIPVLIYVTLVLS